jgi:hypothetical protein
MSRTACATKQLRVSSWMSCVGIVAVHMLSHESIYIAPLNIFCETSRTRLLEQDGATASGGGGTG